MAISPRCGAATISPTPFARRCSRSRRAKSPNRSSSPTDSICCAPKKSRCGGNSPVAGGDFDELALGIGEVEEDLIGKEGGAAGADAAEDGKALVDAVLVGLGVEVIEDGVEGVRGGDGIELIEESEEEPIAVFGGPDGEDEEATGGSVEAHEGLPVGGGEGDALLGDGDE